LSKKEEEMAEPFLSEIKIMSFNFPPKGWALCNGQTLPINQNQALFALLGTTYGGNGQTTFALPNLRGGAPMHMGNGHTLGEKAGTETVTLNLAQLPHHPHMVQAATGVAPPNLGPVGNMLAQSQGVFLYANATNLTPMAQNSTTNIGGSQPHTNMQPYLVLSFCIALQGIFPSRN
jgi:microcystin-dependent protein